MFKASDILRGALLAFLVTGGAGATPFVSETVDGASSSTGFNSGLAIDVFGRSHIVYQDDTANDLRYALKLNGAWVLETVDGTGGTNQGELCAIAVDALGNPHLTYLENPTFNLRYATKSGGVWVKETVETAVDCAYSSITIDAQGRPHVSYVNTTNADLKYATKSGGVWTLQTVDSASQVGGVINSIKLTSAGRPRISYYESLTQHLRYAAFTGTTWTLETVDALTVAGSHNSLVLDNADSPRIAYYAITDGDLKYASKATGIWVIETADAATSLGVYCSIALDGSENPRIAYRDNTPGDLMYAVRSSGGTWTAETVDQLGLTGSYVSLALDSQGNPRISYYDSSTSDLRHADSSIYVNSPGGGAVWPVGALRDLVWSGSGVVDVYLSADGGLTEQLFVEDIETSPLTIRVPHLPTRFAKLILRRASPFTAAFSESLFTIEASIALLGFTAEGESSRDAGTRLQWSTSPGIEDLAGYVVDRKSTGDENWRRVTPMLRANVWEDAESRSGDRYRLSAINGIGQEIALGEVEANLTTSLSAWPLPFRGGSLSISFATASAPGGAPGATNVRVYDVQGRAVRTLVDDRLSAGQHSVTWDGRDSTGQLAAPGIYFVRSRSESFETSLKIVVTK